MRGLWLGKNHDACIWGCDIGGEDSRLWPGRRPGGKWGSEGGPGASSSKQRQKEVVGPSQHYRVRVKRESEDSLGSKITDHLPSSPTPLPSPSSRLPPASSPCLLPPTHSPLFPPAPLLHAPLPLSPAPSPPLKPSPLPSRYPQQFPGAWERGDSPGTFVAPPPTR